MHNRKLDAGAATRPQLSQQLRQSPLRATDDERSISSQRDPAGRIIDRIPDASSTNDHAVFLNRIKGSQPSLARQFLLQLQHRYGNQFVQHVLTISRQGHGNGIVSPPIEKAIQYARGGGQGLDSKVRAQMESAFGTDFRGVRVHTDSEAGMLNRALGARAFTIGRDIFFSEGEYNPGTPTGRKLLAHELAHVVQQGTSSIQHKLTVSQPGDTLEREAEEVAAAIVERVQGRPIEEEDEEERAQAKLKDSHVKRQLDDEEEEEEPILAKNKSTGSQRVSTGPDQVYLNGRRRRRGYAWRWSSSVQGRNREVSGEVEVEDYTQRFLGLVMPARAMLSYSASAARYHSNRAVEVTAEGNAVFQHFESFARFIARGWRTRRARMSDARRLELDPGTGSITLAVPARGTAAGARPERDGPLSITSRVTNTQIQTVNENQKKLVVTTKVHVNVGGSITESVTGGAEVGVGGEFGPEGARVSPEASVNMGGSWSITHAGGERYRLIDATPTFVFNAIRERVGRRRR